VRSLSLLVLSRAGSLQIIDGHKNFRDLVETPGLRTSPCFDPVDCTDGTQTSRLEDASTGIGEVAKGRLMWPSLIPILLSLTPDLCSPPKHFLCGGSDEAALSQRNYASEAVVQ
jgi:hypothetical protein